MHLEQGIFGIYLRIGAADIAYAVSFIRRKWLICRMQNFNLTKTR